VVISGNLQVNGETFTVSSSTVTVDDKNIELGATDTPSDATADGGGITLKGDTDKTIAWSNTSGRWSFNVGIDAAEIEDTPIGDATPAAGSFTTLSSNSTTELNGTTIPSSKTLVTTDDSQTVTNKTIDLANNTLEGSVTEFNNALSGDDFATLAGTENLQNKTLTAPTVSGDLNVDSGTLYVDSANNRVGVGTSSPDAPLDIEYIGPGAGFTLARTDLTNAKFQIDWNANDLNFDTVGAAEAIIFRQDGSEAMRIHPNGNVGIGTNAPNGSLVVRNGASETEQIIFGVNINTGGRDWRIGRDNSATGDFIIKYSDVTNDNNTTEAMRIDSSGNVGIGTSSPSEKLEVNGNAEVTGEITENGNRVSTVGKSIAMTMVFG